MKITATKELESCLTFAAQVGCYPDQLDRFIRAGYIPQAKQMMIHAAAREADNPDGPERIATGGTRGQAKSHAIIAQVGMDDCQRSPGLKWLYLRNIGRAATEQFEDLITKMFSQVPHDYKASRGLLKFPNGSRIILGGFKDESDIDGYLGIEYDGIVIEDATTLSQTKYDAICGSLRTSKPGWRPRLYCSANPGGIGHAWFKRLFVDPWLKGQESLTRFIHVQMGDNVFIDEGYARYLNGLTGWLRKAWRDGDFSIAAGQFFTNFDPLVHVVEPFEIPAGWSYWMSMDYGFVHWNVAYLFAQDGDGNRYVIDEYTTRRTLVPQVVEGILSMLERNSVTLSELDQLIAGPDIFAQRGTTQTIAEEYQGYDFYWEPAQTDRISGAAKIMTYLGSSQPDSPTIAPRLFIFNRCHRLIECLPMMQHDPRRGEDVLKWDCNSETGEGGDDCFVAGTPILTRQGEIPIELVRVGNEVLTRAGWKPVVAAWQAHRNRPVLKVTFSDGREIVGTPNHPFWIEKKGWVYLDTLRYGDIIETVKDNSLYHRMESQKWSLNQSALNSMGSSLDVTRIPLTSLIGAITHLMQQKDVGEFRRFIRKFGRLITGLFPQEIISTIGMATRLIMQLKTWNACQRKYIMSTTPFTQENWNGYANTLPEFGSLPLNGIHLQRDWSGIDSTLKRSLGTALWWRGFVNSAETVIPAEILRQQDLAFVQISASQLGDDYQVQTILNDLVSSVVSRSLSTSMKVLSIAGESALELQPSAKGTRYHEKREDTPVRVIDVSEFGKANSYALHIADQHEYYANSLLVRNCYDSLRYGMMLENAIAIVIAGANRR